MSKNERQMPKTESVKEYRVPKRRQPVFSVVKRILKLFIRVEVENRCGELPERAIVVTNHSAKMGPLVFELYYPRFCVKWGAHEMLGNYRSRFLYLRNVLYIQKLGKRKFPSTVKALFEACFSKMMYRGIKVLPTYTDGRFLFTVRSSLEVLKSGMSVMIFPEDSSRGYFDELTSAHAGFVALAEQFNNRTGEDIPVIPAYYHKRSKRIIIYPALSVKAMAAEGSNRYEIAERVKEVINSIYRENFKSFDEERKNGKKSGKQG